MSSLMNVQREAVAKWMIEHSFATGHGDTIEGLLGELSWQIGEIREHRDNAQAALARAEVVLCELTAIDGSGANVATAEVLAGRVRRIAHAALERAK